jgi:threonine/homoserine/homoserine lactone efflux protein
MPSAWTLALFSFAAIAPAVVPGPAVAYIVTQSADKGRRAGIVSAFGIAADALAGRVRRSGRAARIRRFTTGGIFVPLGITAAAAHRS